MNQLTSEALKVADAIDAAETTREVAAAVESINHARTIIERGERVALLDRAIDKQDALAKVGK